MISERNKKSIVKTLITNGEIILAKLCCQKWFMNFDELVQSIGITLRGENEYAGK